MTEKFQVGEAVSTGWSKFLEKVGPLLLFITLPAVISWFIGSVPEWICHFMFKDMDNKMIPMMASLFVCTPIKIIVSSFIGVGMIRCALKAIDGVEFGVDDYMTAAPRFIPYLVVGLLVGLAAGIGTLFLILPGIFLYIALHWSMYLVVDKNMGPLQALSASWQMVQGQWGGLIAIWFIDLAILIGGVLCLGIGLIPAGLVVQMINAYVYRRMEQGTPELAAA